MDCFLGSVVYLVHFKLSYGTCLNVWMLLGQWIFHMKQVVII